MSLYRLLLTCLWTMSLGVFIVYLDAERVRMQSEALRWEDLRARMLQMRRAATYDYWRTFHYAVPENSLKEYLSVSGKAAEVPSAEEWGDQP